MSKTISAWKFGNGKFVELEQLLKENSTQTQEELVSQQESDLEKQFSNKNANE